MIITALTHSIVGERRLIGPVIALNQGAMAVPLGRQVMRGAWHLTSVLMLVCAIVVAFPQTPHAINAVIGAAWLATGLIDVVWTRGKHIGWPLLVGAGACALYGALG